MLIANLLRVDDDRGGWKAADMSLLRDHLHAATMVGRMAAAREAVRLGYGIEAHDGPSGRLGQWAIAGVAAEAMEVHSKRAAEAPSSWLGGPQERADAGAEEPAGPHGRVPPARHPRSPR